MLSFVWATSSANLSNCPRTLFLSRELPKRIFRSKRRDPLRNPMLGEPVRQLGSPGGRILRERQKNADFPEAPMLRSKCKQRIVYFAELHLRFDGKPGPRIIA